MAAVKDVLVPDIGDFSDVPVVEILVAVGDTIAKDDAMVTLESDKATMEIPAPFGGTVTEILVNLDDRVAQGATILKLETADGASADSEPAAADVPPDLAPEQLEPEPTPTPSAPQATPEPPPPAVVPGEPVHASPIARRMARELGVDIDAVHGSGRLGRVTKDDVQAAANGSGATAAASSAPSATGERLPLTRIQVKAAANLTNAWQTIPHVTHHEDADITDLEAFRRRLNAEQSDVKVTMVALLLKACASALDTFPRFASSLEGDELVVKIERHLGFAADTPNGLVVPVIRDVDRRGLLDIAAQLTELSGKARAGRLSPTEMSGAVFTISSLGGIGGTGFTPIVNPPQVAILGAVRSAMRPVWDGAAFQPRLILPLSLSYDHRVIDGALAARFAAHLAALLGDLRRTLL